MRIDDEDFAAADAAITKNPRYTVEIDFTGGNKKYLTTHDDCEVPPGTAAADVYYRALSPKSFSSISQTVDPLNATSSIGSMKIVVTDIDGALTTLFNTQRAAGRGERLKVITASVGYKGLTWDKYATVQTQLIENITGGKGGYTINCADVQREARKKIFTPKETTLTANISASAITLPVANATGFETVFHGTSYGDSPSSTVGYVKIDDEIIRCTAYGTTDMTVDNETSTLSGNIAIGATTIDLVDGSAFRSSGLGFVTDGVNTSEIRWTGKSTNQLTGVTGVKHAFVSTDDVYDSQGRGVLNTRAELHEVDLSASADRRTEVTEHIYLELPAPKLDYALRTNILYGDSANIPDHWGAGISTTLIDTASYLALGNDLWDTTDDTKGLILRISGKKDVDAKSFIEKSIYQPAGLYAVVGVDAQLGVRRINRTLADASYVDILDKTNIVSFGELEHGKDVQNLYLIDWNYDEAKEKNTRGNEFKDEVSWLKYGKTEAKTMDFGLMHGSKATISTIKNTFNTLRDRYAAPPLRLPVKCLHSKNRLDIGDIVKVDLTDMLRDFADSSLTFSRSMEIERKTVDWSTGQVSFSLIGSAERAGVIVDSGSATVLAESDYTTGHTSLTTALTAAGITYTDSGGVLTITGTGTLAGNASLAAGGNYYYIGDVINNGSVTITNNVGLWIKGFFTNNGTIDGKGQGIAASANGTAGGIGSTKATGGVINDDGIRSLESPTVLGPNSGGSSFFVEYKTGGLTGLRDDLRGSSGATGGTASWPTTGASVAGGVGGDGGAGFRVVCQGADAGVSSLIDLSGNDGTAGSSITVLGRVYYSGTGGGGAAGALEFLLDGSSATITDVDTQFTANNGASITAGKRLDQSAYVGHPEIGTWHSFYEGFPAESHSVSNLRWAYIHDLRDPEEDVAAVAAAPSAITIQESVATNSSLNIVGLEISVTPPSPLGNYYGSRITASIDGAEAWAEIGTVRGTDELVYFVAADGSKYNFRAYPISTTQEESGEYLEDSFTVTTALKTIIGAGNTVQTSATVGEGTNGEGVIIDSTGQKGYNASGVVKYSLDATTGLLTATDAVLSGTITAAAGAIGGWNLSSTQIVSDNNRVILDSSNQHIQVQNAGGTNYIRMNASGLVGVDSVLGTVFNIPTDGSAPTFASGIINSTVFNITSSGILETSANAGNGSTAGVRINDEGIKLYNASSSTPTIHLNSDGTATFTSWASSVSGADIPAANADVTSANTSADTTAVNGLASSSVSGWAHGSDTTKIDGGDIYASTVTADKISTSSLSAISANLGTITSGHLSSAVIQSGSFITSGSFLSAAATASDTTLNVYDTTDFATSGSGQIVDNTNDRDDFSWTGKTATTLTGCTGVLAHPIGAAVISLAASSKSILINNETNEMRFYADRGDGTILELMAVGLTTIGSEEVICKIGSSDAGNSRGGINVRSYSKNGTYTYSSEGYGAYCNSTNSFALFANSVNSYGAVITNSSTTIAPLKIIPKANTTDPTSGEKGAFYVRSDGVLRFHNGTAWKTVSVV